MGRGPRVEVKRRRRRPRQRRRRAGVAGSGGTSRWCGRRWCRARAQRRSAGNVHRPPSGGRRATTCGVAPVVADGAPPRPRDTRRTTRQSVRRAACVRASPRAWPGAPRARQRISSAIQLPTPGKRACISRTAFTEVRLRRARKVATPAAVKPSPSTEGASDDHHAGASSPTWKRTRPKPRGSWNTSAPAPCRARGGRGGRARSPRARRGAARSSRGGGRASAIRRGRSGRPSASRAPPSPPARRP